MKKDRDVSIHVSADEAEFIMLHKAEGSICRDSSLLFGGKFTEKRAGEIRSRFFRAEPCKKALNTDQDMAVRVVKPAHRTQLQKDLFPLRNHSTVGERQIAVGAARFDCDDNHALCSQTVDRILLVSDRDMAPGIIEAVVKEILCGEVTHTAVKNSGGKQAVLCRGNAAVRAQVMQKGFFLRVKQDGGAHCAGGADGNRTEAAKPVGNTVL